MSVKVLAIATALLAAGPAFAQSDNAASGSDHAGPIPYSELAAADAKLNGGGGATAHKGKHMRHHAAKAKAKGASASAGASGATTGAAPASGSTAGSGSSGAR